MKMIARGIYATLPHGQAIPSVLSGADAALLKHRWDKGWLAWLAGRIFPLPFAALNLITTRQAARLAEKLMYEKL